MASQLDYFAIKRGEVELARRAERVRQIREARAPESRRRENRVGRLLLVLRLKTQP